MQTDIPAPQEGLLAWYGPELQSDTGQWVLQLGDAEIAEIEVAGTVDRFAHPSGPIQHAKAEHGSR